MPFRPFASLQLENPYEVVRALMSTLLAGHKTTSHLIGNALLQLLPRRDVWALLRNEPDRIPSVVEEVLRLESPVSTIFRRAVREATVGDVRMPAGAELLLVYASANRDEEEFEHAEAFDVARAPNRHFAFGHGVHKCAGAHLARAEGQIALEVLSRRLPTLRLVPGQTLSYERELMFRGVRKLHVHWDQRLDANGSCGVRE